MERSRNDSEEQFSELIDRVQARIGRRVSFQDWRSLARLYRVHSSELARSQGAGRDPERIRHLNALCLRAYTLLYAAPQRRGRRGDFFLSDLPATFASTWRMQLAVAGLMLACAIVGGVLGSESPIAPAAIVPASMYPPDAIERLATSEQARARFLERGGVSMAEKSVFSSYLFVHNTQVGLLGFAAGILLGVPTLLLVSYNGLLLGAFASIFVGTEQGWVFWAWLIPHAIPELLAIVLCSTAGLLLGRAVVAPGRAGTRRSLVDAGRQALHLVLASVPLFALAALVESFVRQSHLSTGGRFVFAALTLAGLAGYAWVVDRAARRARRTADVSFLAAGLIPDPPRGSPGSAPAPAP